MIQLSITLYKLTNKTITICIAGPFYTLNLDKIIYIGGSPTTDTGLLTGKNFTGCLENLYINSTNVIDKLKNPPYDYYGDTEVGFFYSFNIKPF